MGWLRESSGSFSSDEEAGSGVENQRSTGKVDLKISALYSMHSRDETTDESLYAKNGMDAQRLKSLLRSPPCTCKCRVDFKTIWSVCKAFWALPKQSQDAVLWSIQSEAGNRRKTWAIEGAMMFKVYCTLIPHGHD